MTTSLCLLPQKVIDDMDRWRSDLILCTCLVLGLSSDNYSERCALIAIICAITTGARREEWTVQRFWSSGIFVEKNQIADLQRQLFEDHVLLRELSAAVNALTRARRK
jgi:hypothetical protein